MVVAAGCHQQLDVLVPQVDNEFPTLELYIMRATTRRLVLCCK
jgi:hypothetical protein